MHDGEVAVFNRINKDDDDVRGEFPIFVETVAQLPNVENLTVEQLLTSDFFSMFSTDSPDAEANLAKLGNLIAQQQRGEMLKPPQERAIQELRQQILHALPLGSTEVQRLVQSAVFAYLQNRRAMSGARLRALKDATRVDILKALEGY
jgi:hypothetical protein